MTIFSHSIIIHPKYVFFFWFRKLAILCSTTVKMVEFEIFCLTTSICEYKLSAPKKKNKLLFVNIRQTFKLRFVLCTHYGLFKFKLYYYYMVACNGDWWLNSHGKWYTGRLFDCLLKVWKLENSILCLRFRFHCQIYGIKQRSIKLNYYQSVQPLQSYPSTDMVEWFCI